MSRFYFTYGSEGQPFRGGWTVVEAPNRMAAVGAFCVFHPDKTERLLNCSDIYDEERFMRTEMADTGNLGSRCHEIITLRREAVDERLTSPMDNKASVLSSITEIRESSDIKKVAQMLSSGNWIAICATAEEPYVFSLGRIFGE